MWQLNVIYADGKEVKYAFPTEFEAKQLAETYEQMTIVSRVTIISPDR